MNNLSKSRVAKSSSLVASLGSVPSVGLGRVRYASVAMVLVSACRVLCEVKVFVHCPDDLWAMADFTAGCK